MKFIKIYIEGYVDKFNGRDKENKIVRNILDLMITELFDEVDDEEMDEGIAVFILRITRLTKGMAYGLVIFHGGSTLLLETLSKTRVRCSWEDPVEKTEMLKLKQMKDEDIELLGLKKLGSILGRDLTNVNHPHLLPHTQTFP